MKGAINDYLLMWDCKHGLQQRKNSNTTDTNSFITFLQIANVVLVIYK